MIFVEKTSEIPSILLERKQRLIAAISKYDSIDSIPEEEKEELINSYKHPEIQESLFMCSYNKCAYCEVIPSSGYLEIEHFQPKNVYPELSLEWDNLLPSCTRCNRSKYLHDPISEPIINPCKIDPEPYFDYNVFAIVPALDSPDLNISERTLRVCSLNRFLLAQERSNLLLHLHSYRNSLDESLIIYNNSDTDIKKKRRILKLKESIDIIESLTEKDQKFSGLTKNYLTKCIPYQKAKEQIANFNSNFPEFF